MHSTPQSPHGTVGFFFAAGCAGFLGADLRWSGGGTTVLFVAGSGTTAACLACAVGGGGGGGRDVPGARWAFGAGCGTCCGGAAL